MSLERQEQISNLYRTLLGREPDIDGLTFWVNTPISIEEINKEFVKSPEYIAIKAFHVGNLFKELLCRDPDIEGFKYWVLTPSSVEDIRKEFLKSDEYKNIIASQKNTTKKK